MGQAGVAGALALVDARNVVAADQQVDAGGAGFQRGGRAVHGGRARAHHADALVGQHGVVHHVGRVRPARARDLVREGGHVGAAQAVAAVASTTRRASTAWRPAGIRYRAGPGRRRAAARPARDVRCARPGPARGGTSAGSPSIAGGILSSASQASSPNWASNQARKVSAGRPARGRSAAWASAAFPCARWWPRGLQPSGDWSKMGAFTPRCVSAADAARPAMPPPMMATSSTGWPSSRRA